MGTSGDGFRITPRRIPVAVEWRSGRRRRKRRDRKPIRSDDNGCGKVGLIQKASILDFDGKDKGDWDIISEAKEIEKWWWWWWQ